MNTLQNYEEVVCSNCGKALFTRKIKGRRQFFMLASGYPRVEESLDRIDTCPQCGEELLYEDTTPKSIDDRDKLEGCMELALDFIDQALSAVHDNEARIGEEALRILSPLHQAKGILEEGLGEEKI